MSIPSCRAVAVLGLCCAMAARPVVADEPARIAVALKDHVFTPSEIVVPTGKPVILVVTNQDAEPEEFDSSALKVEKVIAGKSAAVTRLVRRKD